MESRKHVNNTPPSLATSPVRPLPLLPVRLSMGPRSAPYYLPTSHASSLASGSTSCPGLDTSTDSRSFSFSHTRSPDRARRMAADWTSKADRQTSQAGPSSNKRPVGWLSDWLAGWLTD